MNFQYFTFLTFYLIANEQQLFIFFIVKCLNVSPKDNGFLVLLGAPSFFDLSFISIVETKNYVNKNWNQKIKAIKEVRKQDLYQYRYHCKDLKNICRNICSCFS